MGRGGLGVRGRPRWSIQAEARPLQTGRGAGVRAQRPAFLAALPTALAQAEGAPPLERASARSAPLPYLCPYEATKLTRARP